MKDSRPPKRKRRRFQLTPDRLMLGLLAVEGFLLLSERFCWFPFNEKKGWTVLVAVAAISLAFLFQLSWLAVSLLLGRWFQFSLRSLLAMVLAVSVACSWLSVEVQEGKTQREAVEAIRKVGGHVVDDYEYDGEGYARKGAKPPAPARLLDLLGTDFFADVVGVMYIKDDGEEEAFLVHLKGLSKLKSLDLCDTKTTDSGLVGIENLKQLERLLLPNTEVSDALLTRLSRLKRLQELHLTGTRVTDAGLEHLQELVDLRWLDLGDTAITDSGLAHLQGLTQLRTLQLSGTQVTDAGLPHLKGLTQVEYLGLCNTNVTDAGLAHLKGLTNLEWLQLW